MELNGLPHFAASFDSSRIQTMNLAQHHPNVLITAKRLKHVRSNEFLQSIFQTQRATGYMWNEPSRSFIFTIDKLINSEVSHLSTGAVQQLLRKVMTRTKSTPKITICFRIIEPGKKKKKCSIRLYVFLDIRFTAAPPALYIYINKPQLIWSEPILLSRRLIEGRGSSGSSDNNCRHKM